MYYRRKIIVALLQLFENKLEKIRLQKLLFIFTQKYQNKVYDFVPYRFGCFSFSANADLNTMVQKGILEETKTEFKYLNNTNYFNLIKETDRKGLLEIKDLYGSMNSDTLMKHTYLNFPYWAIKSEKAESILTKAGFLQVSNSLPKSDKTILFTIGYEGISLEEYLNRLIKNDVKVLLDVRHNPLSMKYGFSKNQLKKFTENLGIQYLHFPETGIPSERRQALITQRDYDNLFETYRKESLTKTATTQTHILDLLIQHKRIALTCFEANICQCHRKHLAGAIASLPEFRFELKHI